MFIKKKKKKKKFSLKSEKKIGKKMGYINKHIWKYKNKQKYKNI